jgi:hypothetical protein
MLDNPDAQTEEWEDDIFANSPEEAESKCRRKAEILSLRGVVLVYSLGATRISGKLYKCKFCSEVSNAENN